MPRALNILPEPPEKIPEDCLQKAASEFRLSENEDRHTRYRLSSSWEQFLPHILSLCMTASVPHFPSKTLNKLMVAQEFCTVLYIHLLVTVYGWIIQVVKSIMKTAAQAVQFLVQLKFILNTERQQRTSSSTVIINSRLPLSLIY